MTASRRAWALAGVVVGAAGLATSYAAALLLSIRQSPVVAVADLVIRLTPGDLAEWAIQTLGHLDKPALITGILVFLTGLFVAAGLLARRSWWQGLAVYLLTALVGAAAVVFRPGFGPAELVPMAVGVATWSVALAWLGATLRGPLATSPRAEEATGTPAAGASRRDFLVRSGMIAAGSVAVAAFGRWVGGARRAVEEARQLLRLEGATKPQVPADVRAAVEGVAPWMTPVRDFYLVHANYSLPAIEPKEWLLRIHGMVDHEMTYTYNDLVNRELTESWITLNCVSNTVGGDLIGNAWWSGVRVADLLAEVGVQSGADAVLQTSDTGWTCGTPLEALTDDRNALLAVAMNGEPLTVEHGFPVRTVVPGLYGYVSACKWVVDLEVTRFDQITGYWIDKGWSELGPVKLASRIDVPRSGAGVAAGPTPVAGVAWQQHTGISDVQVSLDGGEWQSAALAGVPNLDTWVQWSLVMDVQPGEHELRVRAVDTDGTVQTSDLAPPAPDGATGWHTIIFSADD